MSDRESTQGGRANAKEREREATSKEGSVCEREGGAAQ